MHIFFLEKKNVKQRQFFLWPKTPCYSDLANEIQKQLSFWANKAGEQLWDPGQPLDRWHTNAILVDSICQSVFIIIET